MRAGLILLSLSMLTAGCQREPDFNERFEEHSRAIEQQARSIEITVDKRIKSAEEAEAVLDNVGEFEALTGNPAQ
ncbi:hypothetical protein AB1K62_03985 [Parasphingorhabdus sp. JC815]|uniref:hypothetical protein n=1 Tax=Parasphingorhabdus sp. JC815 TaxID=3232140 RepID=UPI003458BE7B